jgi:hypothetical protein
MHGTIRLRLWSVAATLVMILVLAMGRETPARDDDVVAGADSPARAARGRSAADKPRPSGPFVVSLANGDRLTGRIVAIDGSRLRFRPDVAGDAEIDLPLPRIDHVDHPRAGDSVEPRGDRLYPLAGGVLYGTLARLGPRSLTLDAHLIGRIELPIDTLAAFVRQGCELQPRAAPPEAYQVQRGSEPPLTGSAGVAASGVTVTSATGSVTVPLGELDAVLFPDREPAPLPQPPPAACVLHLLNGCEVVGTAPEWERSLVSVAVAGGGRVAVPVAHLRRMHFDAGAVGFITPRRIVFWSTCADRNEEVSHMAKALADGLPKNWTLDAEGEHPTLDDLEADLAKAGVLVIPEMEKFAAKKLPGPEALGGLLRGFLERGGTVVMAGVGNDSVLAYWKAAGLLSLESAKRMNQGSFTLLADHPLAAGVGDSFASVNATYEYVTEDRQLEPIATRAGGGAAVLAKRFGRGTLVLLGMDYYASSDAVDRLLVNAATLHRVSP